jgi:hypothetical protein
MREADLATGTTYTPASEDQGNSSGGIDTVIRSFPGRYLITFPGLGAPVGIAKRGALPAQFDSMPLTRMSTCW